MPLCVWIPKGQEATFLEELRAALGRGVALHLGESVPAGVSPQILVGGMPTAGQLDRCPDLEHVVIPYAGVPERTRSLLAQRGGIALHNLHHNAAPTAELAMGLLLAVAKRIVPFDRELRRGDWRGRYAPSACPTLEGGHALILGYGAIGQRVARAALGLGMRVSAVRRSAAEGDRHGMVGLAPPSALPRLLPEADAVVVCLPLTQETRCILDPVALRMIRQGAYLVNVGRGELVDEDALFEGLKSGRIGGAGLDVWYRYPEDEPSRATTLPATRPFQQLDNVVLSPHRGGLSRQGESARARALAGLLRVAAQGATMPHRVDLQRGY